MFHHLFNQEIHSGKPDPAIEVDRVLATKEACILNRQLAPMGLQKLQGSQFEDIVDHFPKMNAV